MRLIAKAITISRAKFHCDIVCVCVCAQHRCGGTFCALHRYPETHHCQYDYKTKGRQILEKDNPKVIAEKFPKI